MANKLTSGLEDVVLAGRWNPGRLFARACQFQAVPEPARKEPTVRWNRWIRVTQLAMIAVAPVVTPLTFTAASPASDDAEAVARLAAIVNAPNGNPIATDRDEAARQLVKRNTPPARDSVLAVLKNPGNSAAQTAVAKALATVPHPDESLIPILAGLLGPNPALTEAAASALANYRGNAPALGHLTTFADIVNTPFPVRAHVIKAIGALIDKEAAGYLVDLAGRQNQNLAIQTTAMQALGEMTGLTEYGTDLRQWNQWWAGIKSKNQDQFRAMLLETRARQFELMKQRDLLLAKSSRDLLASDYGALPVSKRPAVRMAYLTDPAPEVRSVGVFIVKQENSQTPPTPEVRERLFQLISDSDDKVRSDVCDFLLTLNDPASLHALIDQLSVEKDPGVSRTIAQILGNCALKDPETAPAAARALIPMLHDPHLDNQIAAAKALAVLGENLHQKDQKLADELSDQIRTILKAADNQPGMDPLRAACVSALAALRDRKSLDTFLGCFKPGETAEVRRAALEGMGNLGDTHADQTVADRLGDPDPTIRLAAARAMETVATPGQDVTLFERMNSETNQGVSDALWIAFKNLYDKEDPAQIQHWANEFKNDPERKIVTLEKLSEVQKRGTDAQAVAETEQAIADAMASVKPMTPARAAEAIGHLQQALNFWNGPGKGLGGSDVNLETLIGQMVDDKLLAGQWKDACDFASDQIKQSPAYRQTVGPIIRDNIDRLIKDGSTTDAQKLIEAALGMKPPLDDRNVKWIQDQQAQLIQKP